MRYPGTQTAWALALLNMLPDQLKPIYFSRTERLRKNPEFEIVNSARLTEYLESQSWYWFHGDGYQLSAGYDTDGIGNVLLIASRASVFSQLPKWFSNIQNFLYYANAGVPAEYEHRNGFELVVPGTGITGHGWVGRDLKKYAPGLYWLNFFSNEFEARYGFKAKELEAPTSGRLLNSTNGSMLQLYGAPTSWVERVERIDDALVVLPGFFSRKRAGVERIIETHDEIQIISELGRDWP